MNLSRLISNRGNTLSVDRRDIESYAKQHYRKLHKAKRATWNGRQIKNAFQTAIALADFDNKSPNQDDHAAPHEERPAVLTRAHFEVVAKASEGFDDYLCRIHGTDADRARRAGERDGDDGLAIGFGRRRSSLALFPLTSPKKSAKKRDDDDDTSDSSSTEDVDPKDRKRSKKEKKAKKYAEPSDSSTSEDDDEKEKKKRKKEKNSKKKAEEAAKSKGRVKAEADSTEETSSSE